MSNDVRCSTRAASLITQIKRCAITAQKSAAVILITVGCPAGPAQSAIGAAKQPQDHGEHSEPRQRLAGNGFRRVLHLGFRSPGTDRISVSASSAIERLLLRDRKVAEPARSKTDNSDRTAVRAVLAQ